MLHRTHGVTTEGPSPMSAEDIQRELQKRRDSQEELKAQQGIYLPILNSHSWFYFFSSRVNARGLAVKGESAGVYGYPAKEWIL